MVPPSVSMSMNHSGPVQGQFLFRPGPRSDLIVHLETPWFIEKKIMLKDIKTYLSRINLVKSKGQAGNLQCPDFRSCCKR